MKKKKTDAIVYFPRIFLPFVQSTYGPLFVFIIVCI